MTLSPLLFEIGVEELPAIPLLKELSHIPNKWRSTLEAYRVATDFEFYYTPRRLVFHHKSFPSTQSTSFEELFGPPLEMAKKDGEWTQAGLSFAKKCGVEPSELAENEKGGKKVLYFKKEQSGKEIESFFGEMADEFLNSLVFGKSMHWQDVGKKFIRPIRWSLALFGDRFLDFEIFGVKSTKTTFAHRVATFDPIGFSSQNEYFEKLKNNAVILEQDKRREKILENITKIEKKSGLRVELDSELLDEVVAITEYPTAVLGEFEREFLELPPEVIITSMKTHQRYFGVFENEKLSNRFIVVSNAPALDFSKIIDGNRRVLRARLSDALFFYRNDLKYGLNNEGLKNIAFIAGLGTLFDKSLRELSIAMRLFEHYKSELVDQTNLNEGELKALLERAIMLGKADLMSEMVYEFPELQGIMGEYYAKAANEHPLVAAALKEQYLPKGEDSELPSTLFSAIVALSVRLDSLFGLYSINQIPTGTKDPFALRRASAGVIRIVSHFSLPLNIKLLHKEVASEYKPFVVATVWEFFLERLNAQFDYNKSCIKAAIESGEEDILELVKKISAIGEIAKEESFKERFATFKRVANIIKDEKEFATVDAALFESEYENALYKAFIDTPKTGDYKARLEALFGLKPQLDGFFDNVMVNVENEAVKNNRKALIALIYHAIKECADIKEISL